MTPNFRMLRVGWVILCLALMGASWLPWNLEEYDQAKQAFVSLEMVNDGHWLMQHTPAGNPATKPPLAGWISTGIYKVTGWWDLAWRLPSFLAAIALFVVIGRLGFAAGGMIGMWVGEAMFVFNMLTPRIATLVRTDMLLTLLIASTVFVCYIAARDSRNLTAREILWLGLLSAASFLTKGPILYAFLLPALIAFAVWERKPRLLLYVFLATLPGLLLFAGWAAWCMRDPAFYDLVVVKEFMGRFSSGDGSPHKSQPIYFYFVQLLPKLLPWSLAFGAALFVPEVRRRLASPGARFLICAALASLLVMSVLPSKRVDRVYPIVPMMCVLGAVIAPAIPRRWVIGVLAAAALGWTSYEAAVVTRAYKDNDHWLAKFGASVRDEANRQNWQVGLVRTNEEGIYLYLRQTNGLDPRAAAADLKSGKVQALVMDKKRVRDIEKQTGPLSILLSADHPDSSTGGMVFTIPRPK